MAWEASPRCATAALFLEAARYGEDHVRLVKEILGLQAMGLSLDDTRPFVECLRAGNAAGDSCPDSIEVYRRKLAEVKACLDRCRR